MFAEKIIYYSPELLKSLRETGIMLSISVLNGFIGGLIIGTLIFLYGPNGVKQKRAVTTLLNGYVNIIRSFPFLLMVVAVIPLTRTLFGTAFGPLAASFPLSLVAVAIYSRLVEQVLLDIPKDVMVLADSLGATHWQLIKEFLLVEAKSGLVLALTSMLISLISYSTVMGVVGGGGIGDFAIRYGYQRYETGIMYTAICLMIVLVGCIQLIGTHVSKNIDKRK